MSHRIVWVDIPVRDLDRAIGFYAAVTVAEAHGGTVLQPPHSMGPHGWKAIVLDSEGNRLALYASVA